MTLLRKYQLQVTSNIQPCRFEYPISQNANIMQKRKEKNDWSQKSTKIENEAVKQSKVISSCSSQERLYTYRLAASSHPFWDGQLYYSDQRAELLRMLSERISNRWFFHRRLQDCSMQWHSLVEVWQRFETEQCPSRLFHHECRSLRGHCRPKNEGE